MAEILTFQQKKEQKIWVIEVWATKISLKDKMARGRMVDILWRIFEKIARKKLFKSQDLKKSNFWTFLDQ